MTRRERILTALSGGIPDRPPIAFDSHGDSLRGVLEYYGARDKDDLYAQAGIDGFSVWEWNAVTGRRRGPARTAADGMPLDFWGSAIQHSHGLSGCGTVAALRSHRWPRAADFDFSSVAREAAAIIARDQVVAAGHLGVGYQMHAHLRGNEHALYDLSDAAYMRTYLDQITAFTLEYIEALLTAGNGRIEVVRADDDMGTMDRLMLSPAMWRNYYKPCWRQVFEAVHRHGAKVWFHSCGHVRPLLADLIEIGIDCWNPFPGYVKGNDHRWLRDFRRGRGLALDGGVSHLVLVQGAPQDVIDETRRVLDLFAPDGGFLIGPSQVLTEDMPLANRIAFFETARQGAGCVESRVDKVRDKARDKVVVE